MSTFETASTIIGGLTAFGTLLIALTAYFQISGLREAIRVASSENTIHALQVVLGNL